MREQRLPAFAYTCLMSEIGGSPARPESSLQGARLVATMSTDEPIDLSFV
jgi:hypothetical protein